MFLIISAVIILLFTFYDSAQYFAVFEWTEGRRGSIFELFEGFGKNFKYAIVLFLIRILMVLLLCIFIPFLRSYGGIFLIPAFVLSWFAI
ncbi:MAG: hypothetical protein K6G51_00785, partial [Sphaerochaetaceae bacterium]|nr:hypothetical protein [Sphaerochaetaceae bacterium]